MRRLPPLILAVPLFFAIVLPSIAQMPMGGDTGKVDKVQDAKPAVPAATVQDSEEPAWQRNWEKYMGEGSPYRSVILAVLTLLILINIKSQLTKVAKRYLDQNAFKAENAKTFIKVWNHVWKFIIAVLVIIAMSGSLKLLGLTAGFFGMMLGWSLQQPVTGIAAWLMIVLKKPFRIGDRVIIAGITGDVTGITLTHVILNQVGGSIGGEEKSGRGILIPNAILFQNTIINYTLEQAHMLDEVPVRLTFDSDWELAKKLTIEAASEATAEIVESTGEKPFIRAEFLDWGILIRLRFNTIPVRRQEISTTVIELLLKSFRANYPRIRFAIPSSNVRYRRDDGGNDDEGDVAEKLPLS